MSRNYFPTCLALRPLIISLSLGDRGKQPLHFCALSSVGDADVCCILQLPKAGVVDFASLTYKSQQMTKHWGNPAGPGQWWWWGTAHRSAEVEWRSKLSASKASFTLPSQAEGTGSNPRRQSVNVNSAERRVISQIFPSKKALGEFPILPLYIITMNNQKEK